MLWFVTDAVGQLVFPIVLDCSIIEDWTDKLSRNVSNQVQICVVPSYKSEDLSYVVEEARNL
jgi:hypothetical protein